jgi:Ca-activated chloride channel homolog
MFRKFLMTLAVCLLATPLMSNTSLRAAPLLDVMFLLDGSGSVSGSSFINQAVATQTYINVLQTGVAGPPDLQGADLNAGIVQFSTSAQLVQGLTNNIAAVNIALDNMFQLNGQTNHADAFTLAAAELAANGRAGAQQAIVLITDGTANEPSGGPTNPLVAAINAANDAKNDGILIFAIGAGSGIQLSDLENYASSPTEDFTAHVSGHILLPTVTTNLAEALLTEATVSVNAPAPLALLGLGFAGLACLRRRRSIAA